MESGGETSQERPEAEAINRAMKRPKVEPIRSPTLFEMGKLETAADLMSKLNLERTYSEPGLYLGTSAFTANGWQGSFYPKGMKPREYLSQLKVSLNLSILSREVPQ